MVFKDSFENIIKKFGYFPGTLSYLVLKNSWETFLMLCCFILWILNELL
jgi:hypothetical protein